MTDDIPSVKGLPTCLDDLVRRNRGRFEVGLATTEEIAAVIGHVPETSATRGTVDDWRLLAFRHRTAGVTMLHVLGNLDGSPWITSCVVALSPDRARVRTKNSFYQLGRSAPGEPELRQLLHVAYTLKSWGFDVLYGLDVIDVFYFD